jgi:hypothetical protein
LEDGTEWPLQRKKIATTKNLFVSLEKIYYVNVILSNIVKELERTDKMKDASTEAHLLGIKITIIR